jgi:uncharacterized protein (DUF1501 family)
MIVPYAQNEYDLYASVRQNLSLPRASLLPVVAANTTREFSFHPSLSKMQTLFAEGHAAPVFNVGPLLYPITRAQYQNKSVATPPQLFSHSDQVTHWQTSLPDQPARTGWGGRIADIIHPQQYELLNDVPTAESAKLALCTSLAGANTFEVGTDFTQYHVSTSGAISMSNVSGLRLTAVQDLLALNNVNLQRNAYADVMERALSTATTLNNAISATSSNSYWTTPFPNLGLANQLKMVARLIQGRSALNMRRQIFFVQVGGYDTHTAQVGTNAAPTDTTVGSHASLMFELSESLFAFQRAMEQIGVADKVTSFTASDFGRTFPTNGQGSDHGWGSHHFVVGGAVKGGKVYGTFPVHQINGPDDTSTGRWIPKISVDEYSATLAKWFGVSPTYMSTVFPNLGRFSTTDLGFML